MVVLNSQELGRIGPTAALSVVLTMMIAAAALPLWLLVRRLRLPAGALPPAGVPREQAFHVS